MPEPTIENIIRFGFHKMRMITDEEYRETSAVYVSDDTGYGIETDRGNFDVLILDEYVGFTTEYKDKPYVYLFDYKDEKGDYKMFYICKV